MEANGLKWQNVNLVTGILSVRQGRVLGKDKDPKTERAVRAVEITPGMRRTINDQKARSNPGNDYMFVTEQGQPLDISNFRAKIMECRSQESTPEIPLPLPGSSHLRDKAPEPGI